MSKQNVATHACAELASLPIQQRHAAAVREFPAHELGYELKPILDEVVMPDGEIVRVKPDGEIVNA
jgi:hypothetical protein